jgi:hypothetical protein
MATGDLSQTTMGEEDGGKWEIFFERVTERVPDCRSERKPVN